MTERFYELHLIHSNDLHSHLDRMSRISGHIQRFRNNFGIDHVIALDMGDHLDRMDPVTEGTQGRVNVAVLNQTGYDAIAFGNNEGLTFEAHVLQALYDHQARMPMLAANLYDLNGQRPSWVEPYTIIQKGPIKVGIIGVTIDFNTFYELLGWHIREPLAEVADQVRVLRDQVDLLCVASHVGISADRKMAATIDGIDAIFGAHTHHRLDPPEQVGNTWLFAAGKFGQVLGHAQFVWDTHEKKLAHIGGRLIDLGDENAPIDETIDHTIAMYRQESDLVMSGVAMELSVPLHHDASNESLLANVMATQLRRGTEAEIGLVNSGVFLHGFPFGRITKGDLLSACPSPINPCIMLLNGSHILQALELSLDETHIQKSLMGYGFRGKVIGTLAVDGLLIQADRNQPVGKRIVSVEVNGELLNLERKYRVGTIDLFTFHVAYPSIGLGTTIEYVLPDFIRDWLASACQSEELIEQASNQKWKFI